jgi:hypothetical protein
VLDAPELERLSNLAGWRVEAAMQSAMLGAVARNGTEADYRKLQATLCAPLEARRERAVRKVAEHVRPLKKLTRPALERLAWELVEATGDQRFGDIAGDVAAMAFVLPLRLSVTGGKQNVGARRLAAILMTLSGALGMTKRAPPKAPQERVRFNEQIARVSRSLPNPQVTTQK